MRPLIADVAVYTARGARRVLVLIDLRRGEVSSDPEEPVACGSGRRSRGRSDGRRCSAPARRRSTAHTCARRGPRTIRVDVHAAARRDDEVVVGAAEVEGPVRVIEIRAPERRRCRTPPRRRRWRSGRRRLARDRNALGDVAFVGAPRPSLGSRGRRDESNDDASIARVATPSGRTTGPLAGLCHAACGNFVTERVTCEPVVDRRPLIAKIHVSRTLPHREKDVT
jgi:hypothetical protein